MILFEIIVKHFKIVLYLLKFQVIIFIFNYLKFLMFTYSLYINKLNVKNLTIFN